MKRQIKKKKKMVAMAQVRAKQCVGGQAIPEVKLKTRETGPRPTWPVLATIGNKNDVWSFWGMSYVQCLEESSVLTTIETGETGTLLM